MKIAICELTDGSYATYIVEDDTTFSTVKDDAEYRMHNFLDHRNVKNITFISGDNKLGARYERGVMTKVRTNNVVRKMMEGCKNG